MIIIFLIALSLSMDAFAVSVISGGFVDNFRGRSLRIPIFLGIFQGVMPLIGWYSGNILRNFVYNIDHWIAFGILLVIGVKMIYEGLKIEKRINPLNIYILIFLSIATSIDALAIGFTYSFLRIPIVLPAIITGGVTFTVCFTGLFIGNKVNRIFGERMEVAGGIMLIIIGISILIRHLISI